jgi:hypothetical protein
LAWQTEDGKLFNSNILNDISSKEIEENIDDNIKEITTRKEEEVYAITAHPSHASHPSPIESSSSLPSDKRPTAFYISHNNINY